MSGDDRRAYAEKVTMALANALGALDVQEEGEEEDLQQSEK